MAMGATQVSAVTRRDGSSRRRARSRAPRAGGWDGMRLVTRRARADEGRERRRVPGPPAGSTRARAAPASPGRVRQTPGGAAAWRGRAGRSGAQAAEALRLDVRMAGVTRRVLRRPTAGVKQPPFETASLVNRPSRQRALPIGGGRRDATPSLDRFGEGPRRDPPGRSRPGATGPALQDSGLRPLRAKCRLPRAAPLQHFGIYSSSRWIRKVCVPRRTVTALYAHGRY
jgi:hypothetical protein